MMQCSGIERHRSCRRALTIVELLVVIVVIALLTAILLPAIGAARESSRRTQCVSRLRQIGIALHNHHSAKRWLPPGWQRSPGNESGYGWGVHILPFLDERQVYEDVNVRRPVDCSSNAAARGIHLAEFTCPSDIVIPTFTLYTDDEIDEPIEKLVDLPSASYVGVYGTWDPDEDGVITPKGDGAFGEVRHLSFRQFRRGLSKTVVVGERTMARLPATWMGVDFRGDDAICRLTGIAQTAPNSYYSEDDPNDQEECEFDSRHQGGANFLWADGHVGLVEDNIDEETYKQLARIFSS